MYNKKDLPKVVIWGDGQGSTFRSTVDAINLDIVRFQVVGVITTSKNAGILEHVNYANSNYNMDIKTLVVNGRPGQRQDNKNQHQVLDFLYLCGAKSLVLMGALVIMGDLIVSSLNGAVMAEDLPKDIKGASKLMVKSKNSGYALPKSFPKLAQNPGQYGLTNSHPAPTIVTANTYGVGAQKRMLKMFANESAVTYHAVANSIDTGPILACHKFPTNIMLSKKYNIKELNLQAERLNKKAQRIEKAYLPLDVEQQLYARQEYLKNL